MQYSDKVTVLMRIPMACLPVCHKFFQELWGFERILVLIISQFYLKKKKRERHESMQKSVLPQTATSQNSSFSSYNVSIDSPSKSFGESIEHWYGNT